MKLGVKCTEVNKAMKLIVNTTILLPLFQNKAIDLIYAFIISYTLVGACTLEEREQLQL